MDHFLNEHERTMAFAELALGQIRSLRQSAIPRNYEIWYVYATGYNPELNRVINETLTHQGALNEADLEQIYDTYLSHNRTSDRIDKVGARVVSEISDVVRLLTAALDEARTYGNDLHHAARDLTGVSDREQLRSIVDKLVRATLDMHETNRELEIGLGGSRQQIQDLQQSLEAMRAESLTDPLTGLGNRKHFDRAMDEAVKTAKEASAPMSLLMFDIDHFKLFNDNYGHLTGDQVLRLVAMCLKQTIKGQDITARYGGEEFAVVLPHTALRHALTVADNIRHAVMSKELRKKSTGEVLGRVTISVGVATLNGKDDVYSLIERADACLYAAKRAGRNRAVCEIDPEYATLEHIQVA